MKDILWLASWYPNRLEPLNGDFIERHARAASLYNRITVLYVVRDPLHPMSQKYFIEERKYNDNFSARILYYKPVSRIRAIDSLFTGMRYFIFFSLLIRQYIDHNGTPSFVHVQVAWRAGLMALYCKWRYRLSYAISEHWTVFLPEAVPGFKGKNFFIRRIIKSIYKNASGCSAVSVQLASALQKRFGIKKPPIIPNVVDTELFRPMKKTDDIFRFIHISEFNYQKNPEQIFEAIGLLKTRITKPFEMLVFAPDEGAVTRLALKYSIRDIIQFRNYVPQDELSQEMSRSDALLLYSRFETFGCVVIEAMASGIPVIVGDIPVMHEIVRENTGIIVPVNAPRVLAERMLWMMDNQNRFDSIALAAYAAENYSFEKIGKLFDEFYKKI